VVAEKLEGRRCGHTDRSRLVEGEIRRLLDELVLGGPGVLGEGARTPAEDLVTGSKALDILADRLDGSGKIRSRHAVPRLAAARPRGRLSRNRVVPAALAHGDAGGLEALSMRKIADEIGVAPMALYRHVANKDDLIDGMVDVVFSEIELPSSDEDWRTAMRR